MSEKDSVHDKQIIPKLDKIVQALLSGGTG